LSGKGYKTTKNLPPARYFYEQLIAVAEVGSVATITGPAATIRFQVM